MTASERATLRLAIRNIMDDDGDFYAGISALAKLAGMDYPAARILSTAKRLDPRKLAGKPNTSSRVKVSEYFEEYGCGCVSAYEERKKDLLGYCYKHGDSRRTVFRVPTNTTNKKG